ncbi:MAG: hypothetical protein AB7H43_14065 [Acidimicrobiia bacterium]
MKPLSKKQRRKLTASLDRVDDHLAQARLLELDLKLRLGLPMAPVDRYVAIWRRHAQAFQAALRSVFKEPS